MPGCRLAAVRLVATALVLGACGPAASPPPEATAAILRLESAAFSPGETIPIRNTCDGEDVSPSLAWSAPAAGVQSFVLVLDDPDAPGGKWVHWVLFNLPATCRSLPEGSGRATAENVGVQGRNSWGKVGYGGPCPPKGSTHRYDFKLYALDVILDLAPGAARADVEKAMSGHILAEGQLVGRYGR